MKKIYEGKARDIYEVENDLILVSTDRISVHIPLPYKVKYKGQVLNKMSEFWFNKFENTIPNHMITADTKSMPKYFQNEDFLNRCMLVKKLKMLPFECIVRGHITGTCWESESIEPDFSMYNDLFQSIKWEDVEPYNIDELLKQNGVER